MILLLILIFLLAAQPVLAEDQVTPKADDEDPIFKAKARVHARLELEHLSDDVEDGVEETEIGFLIRRARLKFIWRPTDWVMGVVQVGGSRGFDPQGLLRNAYIHVSPLRYLELRVGQFKKPMSGLELRSSGKMRAIERGEGNHFIIEDLLYGDRDLGVQASGRLIRSVKLDYSLGLFNGNGPNIADEGKSKDVVARLKIRPTKWLRVGVNGSLKLFDDGEVVKRYLSESGEVEEEIETDLGWAGGADVVLKFFGARLHLESIFASDWSSPNRSGDYPLIVNGLAILSYRHDLQVSWGLEVEPLFKFEILDPNMDIAEDEGLLFSPGLNTYFGKYLRLMIHAEIRRSGENWLERFDNREDREVLMVQLCFDV